MTQAPKIADRETGRHSVQPLCCTMLSSKPNSLGQSICECCTKPSGLIGCWHCLPEGGVESAMDSHPASLTLSCTSQHRCLILPQSHMVPWAWEVIRLEGELSWGPYLCIYWRVVHT